MSVNHERHPMFPLREDVHDHTNDYNPKSVLVWFAGPTRCPVRLLTFQAATQLLTAKTTLFCWIGFYVFDFCSPGIFIVWIPSGFRSLFRHLSSVTILSSSFHSCFKHFSDLNRRPSGTLYKAPQTDNLFTHPASRLALAVPMSGLGSS